ncbi:hypothetical protein CDAR_166421 [Caerostris darwini]|uniref:Uncharacterized protein n=1 Tax=Caerostris darwini TaxID=1538125 RepID=A0AAV4VWK6_9ARAC|nr:hypothetical protein CDAR_166421 [Caerostris darwini]
MVGLLILRSDQLMCWVDVLGHCCAGWVAIADWFLGFLINNKGLDLPPSLRKQHALGIIPESYEKLLPILTYATLGAGPGGGGSRGWREETFAQHFWGKECHM